MNEKRIAKGRRIELPLSLDELVRMADWDMRVQRHPWAPMTEVPYDIEVDLT